MGNRCVITTKANMDNNGVGIYLHWNGGRDSVAAFLEYCELRGFRAPSEDEYGWARLAQVIANFMDAGGLSVGVDTVNNLDCDNGDNGVFLIDGWRITGRMYFVGAEQDLYSRKDMLKAIDDAQPAVQQIGGILTAEKVPTSDLMPGDKIYLKDDLTGHYDVVEVVGCGQIKWVNGSRAFGVPFCNKYGATREEQEKNPNNYLRGAEYYYYEEPIEVEKA